jgi:hypothetical protein
VKGSATIEACGLNRRQLVDGRRRARNTDAKKIAAAIQQQPFADVCQTMLRQTLAQGLSKFSPMPPWPG